MLTAAIFLAAALQAAPPPDPHGGAFTKGLGVDCTHCHRPDDWKARDMPPFAMAVRMSKLVAGLSEGTLRPFGGITCFTCHRGAKAPARLPPAAWQSIMAAWPASRSTDTDDLKLRMSVFAASLSVDCEFCHDTADWRSDAKKPMRTARVMLTLFNELPEYFDPASVPRFQCYSCHQGGRTPRRS